MKRIIAAFLIIISPTICMAQQNAEQDDVKKTLKELKEKVERLEKENTDLRNRVNALEDRKDVAKQEKEEPKPQQPPQNQPKSINAFNPAITAFGNFMGRMDNKTVRNADGENIDDRFFLRAAELEIRAPIDPYADGMIVLPFEAEGPNRMEGDIEEAYALIKKLPILEEAPLGLRLKIGKFRPDFGQNNKLHLHDLPWTTRPLPIAKFLGTEGLGESAEGGFQSEGVNAEIRLPSFTEESDLTASLAILNGGNTAVSANNANRNPSYLAHLNWFNTFSDTHDVSIGLSGYKDTTSDGMNDNLAVSLYGLDFLYKWKPLEKGEWHSIVAGGELFYADIENAIGRSQTPFGYFLYLQYQLDWHWYLGARYDYSENIDNQNIETRVWAGYLTYYTSEFLRFRLGVEHRQGDLPQDDNLNTLFFELNWVFGSHPTEPYWVNR